MKNEEIYLAKTLLENVSKSGNNSFKLNVLLNLEMVEERIHTLEKVVEPSEKIKEFQNEQRKLIFEYCEKDANGSVILYSEEDGKGTIVKGNNEKGHLNIIKDKEKFGEIMNELSEKYKDDILEQNEKATEFSEILKEEAKNFNLIKFDFDKLPDISYEDLKTLKQLNLLNL